MPCFSHKQYAHTLHSSSFSWHTFHFMSLHIIFHIRKGWGDQHQLSHILPSLWDRKRLQRINTNSVCVYGVGWDHPALSLGLTECLSSERRSLNAGSLTAIWDWLSHWASLYGWQLLVLYVAPLAPGPPSLKNLFSASNI